jgi:uncharacterized protein (TIGR00369 family)
MTTVSTGREALWLQQGYAPWPMAGRFVPAIARVFFKPAAAWLAFRVEASALHCNGFGLLHGGFISTMADIWLGYNVAHMLDPGARFVTSSLSVDFLGTARAGDCLDSQIDRIKLGARLCHASGAILVGDKPVAAMRAAFTVVSGPSSFATTGNSVSNSMRD